MGNNLSSFGNISSSATADDLYIKENSIKGVQVVSAIGASIILSPVIIVALPFVGAYEFGTALESELLTGHKVTDGMIGGLFGVIASPLAPFYCLLLSLREIFNAKQHRCRYPSKNYMSRADGMLRLKTTYYNIAITGCPGTGKSTLLNGLLGYKDNHKNAAAVGETETTMEPKSYRHPVLNTLYLWDMPGVGTPRHPAKGYFENYYLGAFDAILIVFDDRLMASDVDIARQAKRYNVPVFYIKNKADVSIDRKMQRMRKKEQAATMAGTEKWALAVSELTIEVKNTIYKNMKRFNLDTNRLYIVSANTLREFVFMLLYGQQSPTVPSTEEGHNAEKASTKLIHEKVLITNLLETVANRDINRHKNEQDDNNDCSSCCSSTSSPIYI